MNVVAIGRPMAEDRDSSRPDLVGIPKAAGRIGVHPDTLYRLARTGQFPPAIHVGSRWRVSVPRLERFLHGEGDG